jgi:hypothetical protein
VRIVVNFYFEKESWLVQALDVDTKRPISPALPLPDDDMLIRLLRYIGATEEGLEHVHGDIGRWSRGSIRITLVPGRKNLLRIQKPWANELGSPP